MRAAAAAALSLLLASKKQKQNRRANPRHFFSGYFVPALLGYILALCCAYLVVAKWCLAQPALLYIVPLSLWSVLLLAWCRGELGLLWRVGPDPHWCPPPSAMPSGAINTRSGATSSAARHDKLQGPRPPPGTETLLPSTSTQAS